eukprot:7228178-Ditylum_brightwellii.AAC.1
MDQAGPPRTVNSIPESKIMLWQNSSLSPKVGLDLFFLTTLLAPTFLVSSRLDAESEEVSSSSDFMMRQTSPALGSLKKGMRRAHW